MDNFDSKPVTIDPIKITDGYLDRADWRVNENSNSGFSNGGLILHQAGATASHYWLYKIFDEEVRNAHINCDIHLHDLSLVQPYCAGWNLGTLIKEGFGGVRNKIDCGPAKHLNTISQQLVNFLGCMQLEWNGAQAVNSFDTFLAPFLRVERDAYIKEVKDLTGQKELTQSQLDKIEKKLEKYAQQCMQNFLYGINVPSRWGSQAPFSNVTLDLECPPDLKNKKVEMAGKTFDFTYGDCQKEMDMINKAFLKTYELGDYSENGFQYPIITVNVDEEFDYDNEVSELLFKITAKYGTPYFSNFVNTGMSKSDLRSMCCVTPDTLIDVELEENIYEVNGEFYNLTSLTKKYGEIREVSGNFYRYIRPNIDSISVEDLQNGVVPEGKLTKVEDIEITIHRKGDKIKLPIRHDFGYKVLSPKGYEKPIAKQILDFDGDLISILLEDGKTLTVTPDHACMIATDDGLIEVRADELKVGDVKELKNLEYSKISSIAKIRYNGKVYDFTMPSELFYANDILTHNCRLRLDLREIRKTAKGGLFGAADNTGSVGVVTINLPRIGYLTKGSEEKFFERLDELLVISKNALEQRRKACQHLYDIGLFPYTKRYLTQGFANHFSTIAINGMNECVLNFMGKTIDDEEAKNFALKVQDYILNRCSDFQEETGNLFNFEASPAESVSYRFFKHDRKQYPNILSMSDIPQKISSEKEEF